VGVHRERRAPEEERIVKMLSRDPIGSESQHSRLVAPADCDDGRGVVSDAPIRRDDNIDAGAHPRLQAVITAARFHGMELDPREFPRASGGDVPSAGALAAWLQNAGMWARPVRLRWLHLMRLQEAGPVVLLFNDGGAGLMMGVNAEHNVVVLPRSHAAA